MLEKKLTLRKTLELSVLKNIVILLMKEMGNLQLEF